MEETPNIMDELIAISYPNESRASEVLEELRTLQAQLQIDLDDVVVVTHNGRGALEMRRSLKSLNMAPSRAVTGAFWGGLVGLISALPFLTTVPVLWAGWTAVMASIGALTGAIYSHYSNNGIDSGFIKQFSAALTGHTSGIFILVHTMKADRVLSDLSRFGGTLLRTSLPAETERQFRDALIYSNTMA